MAIVGDFVVVDSGGRRIGDNTGSVKTYSRSFGTGGRDSKHEAYLSLMVAGVISPSASLPEIKINNERVGFISRNTSSAIDDFHNQIFAFDGDVLKSGNNTITISSAFLNSGSAIDFSVRSVVCHFHQNA